ncbi:MAG: tetratricopeptide repeat protein [Balneolales bacterium]
MRTDDRVERVPDYRMPADHVFVGDQQCQSCHNKEWDDWKTSHHFFAMSEATDKTVLGDFNNATTTEGYDTYRFFREGDRFMVEAPDPDGNLETYEVTYTFGWEPLQQYLVDFGSGKLQALHASWDTERKRWFVLYPNENIQPGDWLHWTRGAMNWNTMCADCHSTNLRQNYFPEADSFNTRWSDINVSCEACHGPGGKHVEFMQSDASMNAGPERIRQDLNLTLAASQDGEINMCAQCHASRQELTGEYIHGEEFLDHYDPQLPYYPYYHPDGQILDEVFEYGSFLQSKMYMDGVRCTDCHDPHTARLKANITDNTLCMQCHEPRYNTINHHFHEPQTEATQCISCHMPGRYYMEVDYRRDHSFRVPRPDLTEKYGMPNTCNDCHSDRSAAWASDAIDNWYGEERAYHFSETLAIAHSDGLRAVPDLRKLAADTTQPEIARATAIWFLGQFPDRFSDEQTLTSIQHALQSESTLIRKSAANILDQFPPDIRNQLLVSILDDPVRAVRLPAVRGLADFSPADFTGENRESFTRALDEYRQYLDFNQYFPEGQMNRGIFYDKKAEPGLAIAAYREALEKDPGLNEARVNLAYLYNQRGQNNNALELLETVTVQEPDFGHAWYSIALIHAEEGRIEESLEYFEQAIRRMPDQGRVVYNYAIALQSLAHSGEAEEAYLEALRIDPDNPDYRYGLITLYLQNNRFENAYEHAVRLVELLPDEPGARQLLQHIRQQM